MGMHDWNDAPARGSAGRVRRSYNVGSASDRDYARDRHRDSGRDFRRDGGASPDSARYPDRRGQSAGSAAGAGQRRGYDDPDDRRLPGASRGRPGASSARSGGGLRGGMMDSSGRRNRDERGDWESVGERGERPVDPYRREPRHAAPDDAWETPVRGSSSRGMPPGRSRSRADGMGRGGLWDDADQAPRSRRPGPGDPRGRSAGDRYGRYESRAPRDPHLARQGAAADGAARGFGLGKALLILLLMAVLGGGSAFAYYKLRHHFASASGGLAPHSALVVSSDPVQHRVRVYVPV